MSTCYDNFERCHYVGDSAGEPQCMYCGHRPEREEGEDSEDE